MTIRHLPFVASAAMLEAAVHPAALRAYPGLYAAMSGTPAYGALRAAVIAGYAQEVGDAQTFDQRHVVTVRVPGTTRVRPNPQVKLSANFFVTVKKEYNEWRRAWWREAIQNAVDAGARNVRLDARPMADGSWLVSCEDDGRGMSEEILMGKFLELGGTSKPGVAGAAGGFGKAKELLLMPWMRWAVHTRDMIVSGQGGSYDVAGNKEGPIAARQGTLIMVRMSGDAYTTTSFAKAFVEECNLPGVRFTIGGEEVAARLRPTREMTPIGDDATVGFRPLKDGEARMIVRTRGLAMFSRWISSDVGGLVIVELTRPSIDILTANRDGLVYYSEVNRALDKLVNQLAADVQSALRDKRKLIRKRFAGEGKFVARRHEAELVESALGRYDVTTKSGELTETVMRVIERATEAWSDTHQRASHEEALATVAAPTAQVLASGRFKGTEHVEAALKQLAWRPDFYVVNEIENYGVPRKFFPATMTPTILKLAKVWTELCRFVLIQLNSRTEYGVGFVFSETMRAAFTRDDDENWLLLNPFGGAARGRILAPTNEADLKLLYSLAIHEATHLVNGVHEHNEAFASALTENMALCADGYRKIKRIVASIKMRGEMKADTE